jgi:hypothetical protein
LNVKNHNNISINMRKYQYQHEEISVSA